MTQPTAFWTITAYFNPAGYERRLANYLRFRASHKGPLVVAELSNNGRFVLAEDRDTTVIRVRAPDVMWHKEGLLNIALDNVPETAKYVAWLDCDVLFDRKDWQALAISELARAPLVQLFSDLFDLGKDGAGDRTRGRTGRSIASLVDTESVPALAFRPTQTVHMRQSLFGLAWAARIDTIRRHRFYDAMIVGSGDRALACAAFGRFDDTVASLHLSSARTAHYLAWAKPFFEDVKARVRCLPGKLLHLWHGEISDRRYAERHAELARLCFDPNTDLIRGTHGLWSWSDPHSEIATMLRRYFESRNEDGCRVTGTK
jgi:hypothetical protein